MTKKYGPIVSPAKTEDLTQKAVPVHNKFSVRVKPSKLEQMTDGLSRNFMSGSNIEKQKRMAHEATSAGAKLNGQEATLRSTQNRTKYAKNLNTTRIYEVINRPIEELQRKGLPGHSGGSECRPVADARRPGRVVAANRWDNLNSVASEKESREQTGLSTHVEGGIKRGGMD